MRRRRRDSKKSIASAATTSNSKRSTLFDESTDDDSNLFNPATEQTTLTSTTEETGRNSNFLSELSTKLQPNLKVAENKTFHVSDDDEQLFSAQPLKQKELKATKKPSLFSTSEDEASMEDLFASAGKKPDESQVNDESAEKNDNASNQQVKSNLFGGGQQTNSDKTTVIQSKSSLFDNDSDDSDIFEPPSKSIDSQGSIQPKIDDEKAEEVTSRQDSKESKTLENNGAELNLKKPIGGVSMFGPNFSSLPKADQKGDGAKTTDQKASLFDSDSEDSDEDLFAVIHAKDNATSLPNKQNSVQASSINTDENEEKVSEPKVDVEDKTKPVAKKLTLFDDDSTDDNEDDLFKPSVVCETDSLPNTEKVTTSAPALEEAIIHSKDQVLESNDKKSRFSEDEQKKNEAKLSDKKPSLFDSDDEDSDEDLFPKTMSKVESSSLASDEKEPVKVDQESPSLEDVEQESSIKSKQQVKKPVGGVSMFGAGFNPLKESNKSIDKPEESLLRRPVGGVALFPPPLSINMSRSKSINLGSNNEKVSSHLVRASSTVDDNPDGNISSSSIKPSQALDFKAMLNKRLAGGRSPTKSDQTPLPQHQDVEEPMSNKTKTLDVSLNKSRSKLRGQRRPPTRQHRHKMALNANQADKTTEENMDDLFVRSPPMPDKSVNADPVVKSSGDEHDGNVATILKPSKTTEFQDVLNKRLTGDQSTSPTPISIPPINFDVDEDEPVETLDVSLNKSRSKLHGQQQTPTRQHQQEMASNVDEADKTTEESSDDLFAVPPPMPDKIESKSAASGLNDLFDDDDSDDLFSGVGHNNVNTSSDDLF